MTQHEAEEYNHLLINEVIKHLGLKGKLEVNLLIEIFW